MRLTLEPTDDWFLVGDVLCRAWAGTDDTGTPLIAVIPWVQPMIDDEAVRRRFAEELSTLQPTTTLDALLPGLRNPNVR